MSKLKMDSSASVIGKLSYGDNVYISQGSSIFSDKESVHISSNSWVLENSVLIGTKKYPINVGQKVVFGHKCIAIGTTIGNLCEIGNGSIFLPGSIVGNNCIFGEGTLIPENAIIPDNSVVVGRPFRIIRSLTDKDLDMIRSMRNNDISILDEENKNIYEGDYMNNIYKYKDKYPTIDPTSYIDKNAEITGDVIIGENCYIASGVRIIGNSHGPIIIKDNVTILENSVLHLLPDNKLVINNNVSIGPNCVIHGCTIGENTIIEAASIISDYSEIGNNCIVKTGSLIKQNSYFKDNSILEGFTVKLIDINTKINKLPDWAKRG